MDRHPQQIKRERQDIKRRTVNIARFSHMRTVIKKVLESTDAKEAEGLYRQAVKTIDKMVSKNQLHKNTGARRKSQITRHINSLSSK